MRIAYVCSDPGVPLGGRKGASVHVSELVRAFLELGHDVCVVARRAEHRGLPVHARLRTCVPVIDGVDGDREGWLKAHPDATPPEAWTMGAVAAAAAFRTAALSEIAGFRPDFVYERYALFGTAGGAAADQLEVPLVLEVNAPLTDEQAAHRQLAFEEDARAIERSIVGRADVLVAVSDAVAAWLRRQGVDRRRVATVSNGVDPRRFAPGRRDRDVAEARRRLGLGDEPVVAFVGTLKPWHAVEQVIRAIAQVRREGSAAKLLVVGDGPRREPLRDLSADLGVADATVFTGAVAHDAVPPLLAAGDVGVAPYDDQEGFYFSPLKVFEYLAAGLPVVAPSIGDLDHCVAGPGAGWSYRPDDAEGLVAALRASLQDAGERADRGARGREHVLACHTWQHVARRVIGLATAAH